MSAILPVSSMRRLGSVALLTLLGAAAAFACATEGDAAPEDKPLPPDASDGIDAGFESESDAEAGALDAGPCSDSGLCTAFAPIDTRINVASIWGSADNDVWAVGTNRTILHYDGASWEKADAIEPDDWAPFTMRAVWLGGPGDVWIADGQMLRHSTGWKGPSATEWTTTAFAKMTTVPTSISGKDGTVLVARQFDNRGVAPDAELVTCGGWSDGGLLEPKHIRTGHFPESGTNGIWSIAMTRSDEAWAVAVGAKARTGSRVVRLHLALPDGGADSGAVASWQGEEHDSRMERNAYGVWGDHAAVWVVGEGGAIRRMTPDRVSSRVFEPVPSPVIGDLHGVYGFDANDVWAVGDDAAVVHWNGEVWTKVATPFDGSSVRPRLLTVWGSAPNDVWIGGNGVLMHFQGKGP